MQARLLIWLITVFFNIIRKPGLPLAIVCFLVSCYSTQKMGVHWDLCLSVPFSVSNGVRM